MNVTEVRDSDFKNAFPEFSISPSVSYYSKSAKALSRSFFSFDKISVCYPVVRFNNERSKGEIVADLSSPKCKSGTFIIRPSESIPPGQEADTSRFYTLFVRSKTQIEKLRIERQQNGRLIFGNRDFDSPIDLFERYAQSEIRPGATLRFPLIIPPASPALPPPKIRLRRLSSSGPRTQKAGWLSVYTTKNAYSDIPNGQWKRYWARLDMDRSKELLTLSLFESGKRNTILEKLENFIDSKYVSLMRKEK